jgi:hypothetical protein
MRTRIEIIPTWSGFGYAQEIAAARRTLKPDASTYACDGEGKRVFAGI